MRIAFIDPFPQDSTNSWTQTVQHLKQGFANKGLDMVIIDEYKLAPSISDRAKKLAYSCLGKKYLFEREPKLLKQMGKAIDEQLENKEVDILFCPSTLPLAYVKHKAQKVSWTDSSFGGLVDLYEPFTNISKRSLHNGHLTEREAMMNCDLTIFSSEWAVDFASEHYRIEKNRFATIPLGANLSDLPDYQDVLENISTKDASSVNLLFIGYDWERKGGEHAVRTHQMLRTHGINSKLTIVGCNPLIVGDVEGIRVEGKLDKGVPAEAARFKSIMMNAHFLLLPSQADCTAIVFSEAAAYGLPVISTDVGGHRSIIDHGSNGFLFSPENPSVSMTEKIMELSGRPEQYKSIATMAREVFNERLSWEAGIDSTIEHFERLVDPRVRLSRAV